MNKKIVITTGDIKGIGKEITQKALDYLKLPVDDIVIIGEKLDLPYETIEVDNTNNADFCFNSLKIACDMANKGEIKGIVTSPVSKKVLFDGGYNFNGQTEVLEHFLGEKNQKAEMIFISKDLRVMLLTRHVKLSDIQIKEDEIINKTKTLNDFLIEKCKIKNPKIAFCALNPHAGEDGLLGIEEKEIINPVILKLNKMGLNVEGAYPADSLFGKIGKKYINSEKQDYDGVISCYHDQGLCAVKALCFDDVVNTTIGLKVIRTSPSHGTAYDIAGKNIANPKSMISAIKLLTELS